MDEAIEAGGSQPWYLETSTERNVEFYSRRGFRIAEKVRLPGQIDMWAMLRD